METFNWVYLIPLAAIIGGITVAIYAIYIKATKDAEVAASGSDASIRALQDNASVNGQILARLDSIEARLAAIESRIASVPSPAAASSVSPVPAVPSIPSAPAASSSDVD